tara:strand:+ start:125828 stop:125938 length:111 start_codon:yes stop_codon:yes gene_type:complete
MLQVKLETEIVFEFSEDLQAENTNKKINIALKNFIL